MSGRSYPEFVDQSKLSAEEFCRKLCIWFEDQGLMSELRAHMRSLMITSLRGTSVGPKSTANANSPKFQALNLLIAEFLMQQQCHYTLSVFSVEAHVHDFTASFGNTVKGRITISDEPFARFQQRDILDILETLGLSPDSMESERITNLYRENDHGEALLTCIFRILPAMSQNRDSKQYRPSCVIKEAVLEVPTRDTDPSTARFSHQDLSEWTSEIFTEEIKNILTPLTLKAEQMQRFQKWLESKVSRVRKEEELKYQRELIDRERILQENLIQRDSMFRQLIDQSQERMIHERNDLQKGRQEMNEIAGQMRQNHEQMARRLIELEEWGDSLRIKELQIEEQKHKEAIQLATTTSKLDIRQHQLDLEFQRLQREREEVEEFQNGVAELKRSLENVTRSKSSDTAAQYNLQQECILLRRELDSTRHLLQKQHSTHLEEEKLLHQGGSKEIGESCSQQALVAREMCHQLQEENSELRNRIRQQERRIEELTVRASHLAAELEDTNTAFILLSSRDSQYLPNHNRTIEPNVVSHPRSKPVTATPPSPAAYISQPPPLPAHRLASPDRSQHLGSGEEFVMIAPPNVMNSSVVTPYRSRTAPARESRRTPLKRVVNYNQSSSDEASPTEETIQQARRRLRAIEAESEVVDRRIKDFRKRFLESTTSAMLYPYSQTIVNPSTVNPRTTTQHLQRNQLPTFGFHSQFENSLPSYTRLNSRPSLYQQVTAAGAQSRRGRMSDLFRYSPSSDNENAVASPHQAQNADYNAHRTCADVQNRAQAQSRVPTRIPQDGDNKRPISSVPISSTVSTELSSQQEPVKLDSRRLSFSSHPQPCTQVADIQTTSINNKPQISYVIEIKNKVSESDAKRNLDRALTTLEQGTLLTPEDNFQLGVDKSTAIPQLNVPSKPNDHSVGTRGVQEMEVQISGSINNVPTPSVMVLLDAPTRDMLSSETDTSCHSSPRIAEGQTISNYEFNRKSIVDMAQTTTGSILNQEVEIPTSDKDGSVQVTPLHHPKMQLDTSRLDSSLGQLPDDDPLKGVNQRDDQLLVTSHDFADRMKSSIALSGTNTSGSVFEGVLSQPRDVSLSSIELSSEDHAISRGGDKEQGGMSDTDFWN